MSKVNIDRITSKLAKLEGGKSVDSIGNIRESFNNLINLVAEEFAASSDGAYSSKTLTTIITVASKRADILRKKSAK